MWCYSHNPRKVEENNFLFRDPTSKTPDTTHKIFICGYLTNPLLSCGYLLDPLLSV